MKTSRRSLPSARKKRQGPLWKAVGLSPVWLLALSLTAVGVAKWWNGVPAASVLVALGIGLLVACVMHVVGRES